MPPHSKKYKFLRLMAWVGLLCLEIYIVTRIYIVPEIEARNAPNGHWETEAPLHSPLLWALSIVYVVVFILGNIGLIIMTWQRFKDLRIKE